jgi:hypothetical protein
MSSRSSSTATEANMTKMKSEIRAATFHEVGVQADNLLEAAKVEAAGNQMAKQALLVARQRIEQHSAVVDRDVEAGKLTLVEASKAKHYITQCANILESLAVQAEVQMYLAQGKASTAAQLVQRLKTSFDQEKAKAEAEVPSGPTEPPPTEPLARAVGAHPGNPLASRRAGGGSPAPEPKKKAAYPRLIPTGRPPSAKVVRLKTPPKA